MILFCLHLCSFHNIHHLHTVCLTLPVCRDLHGDGDDGNTAESAGNPRELVQLFREYRGDGTKTCGNTAGKEFIAAENPWVCFGKRAIIRFLD